MVIYKWYIHLHEIHDKNVKCIIKNSVHVMSFIIYLDLHKLQY
jgi:hypothetical protein